MPEPSPNTFRIFLKESPALESSSSSFKIESTKYEMVPKDGVVIGFVMTLWLYSIYLMFKAWKKILNFSEDQLQRPEKASVLWKWVMELILHNRQGGRKKDKDSISQNESSNNYPMTDEHEHLELGLQTPYEDYNYSDTTFYVIQPLTSSLNQEESYCLQPHINKELLSVDIENISDHFSTIV